MGGRSRFHERLSTPLIGASLGMGVFMGCGGVSENPLARGKAGTAATAEAGAAGGGSANVGGAGSGASSSNAGGGLSGGGSAPADVGSGGSREAGSAGGGTDAGDTTAGATHEGDTTAGGTDAGDTTAGDTTAGDTTAGATSSDPGGSGGGRPRPIPPPSGTHPYCSMRDPSGTDSELSYADEPCDDIMQRTGWGQEQIERAGLFETLGKSSVIAQCSTATGTWWAEPGSRAIDFAIRDLQETPGCVFAVAPQRLPVFSAPFSLQPLPAGFQMSNRGYDFATLPGTWESESQATLDVRPYSQSARVPSSCTPPRDGCSRVVSYRGQDRTDSLDDDLQGFTWVMDAGAPVLAMAEGEVIAKRARPVMACHTTEQNELYIRHVVGTSLESRYAEIFIAYYAHLDFAGDIAVGSVVERGQLVGYVGNSGCTEGRNQLHLAVLRGSNTAREYRPPLDTTVGVYGPGGSNPDNSVARIDPWGWMASQLVTNIDPGAFFWYHLKIPGMGPGGATRDGGGAFSIALFKAGEAPPRPCDEDDRQWEVEGGGVITNPVAHCSP